jgi:aerobic carbon-monoxide dehydrogenase medium subunit
MWSACARACVSPGCRHESGVFRAKEIEAALAKKFDASALDSVKVSAKNLMGDIHASPEYRANLIVVMAKRAVAQANG